MGSGIAYFLSKKWPEVYMADINYTDNSREICVDWKLGTFSKAVLMDSGRWVYNLYGQVGIGNDGTALGRNCNYDHLYNAMYRACSDMCSLMGDDTNKISIGVPKYMGCARAGGSWIIVDAMLRDLESRYPVEFIVYEFGDEVNPQSTQPTLKNILEIRKLSEEVGCDNQTKNR
jgi:hypothetical protein